MFKSQFVTVRKGLVACIYSPTDVTFRVSKLGEVLKSLSPAKSAEVIADLKGFDAKAILTAAFNEVDLVIEHA